MSRFKAAACSGAVLMAIVAAPAAAQQPPQAPGAMPGAPHAGAAVPDATVTKAGPRFGR